MKIPTKKFPDFLQLKFSLLRSIVFLLNPTRAPKKTAARHPVEQKV